MAIVEVIIHHKRKKPLGDSPCRKGIRFPFQKLFKSKEANLVMPIGLNNRQKFLQT